MLNAEKTDSLKTGLILVALSLKIGLLNPLTKLSQAMDTEGIGRIL